MSNLVLVKAIFSKPFFRFAVAGGLGFAVDAIILSGFLWLIGLYPKLGRICSILIAMIITWLINRTLTFHHSARPTWQEWWKYCAVNSVGAAVNYGIYVLAIEWLPIASVIASSLAALVIATSISMFFNYAGMKRFVFSKKKKTS